MSESDDSDVTRGPSGGARAGRGPGATVELYAEGGEIAAVVSVADATLVLGHAPALVDRLERERVEPDHYLDIAPDPPAWYGAAMRETGARVHDAAELRARAAGLYADGFSVRPGVGVVPCKPSRTVLVRFLDRGEPVDLLFSNAPAGEPVEGSLSGALPVYGAVDDPAGGTVAGTGGRSVERLRVVGAAWVLGATGEGDRAREAGVDVAVVDVPGGAPRAELSVEPRGGVADRATPVDGD